MDYNLFLDDDNQRTPYKVSAWFAKEYRHYFTTNVWERVYTYDQFVKMIKRHGLPQIVSFDHDLAEEHYARVGDSSYKGVKGTGFHCMQFMIEYMIDNELPPPRVFVHSMNPVGRENIAILFNNFLKHFKWETSKEYATLTDK